MLPIAGDQVTNDIAMSLRTPTPEAEQIKVRYACALAQLATAEETIQVPSVGDRPPRRLARQSLAEAVEPRYEEIFELMHEELRRSGFEELVAAGMVLTGGSAKMEGVVELAEEMLHMPVRVGIPQYVDGLCDVVGNPDPRHRRRPAAVAARQALQAQSGKLGVEVRDYAMRSTRMKAWFQGNF